MSALKTQVFISQTAELGLGFPYFVTRLEPAHYHFILLPADKPIDQLQEQAQTQAVVNDLPPCLALGSKRGDTR
jgi:hypothetical protein